MSESLSRAFKLPSHYDPSPRRLPSQCREVQGPASWHLPDVPAWTEVLAGHLRLRELKLDYWRDQWGLEGHSFTSLGLWADWWRRHITYTHTHTRDMGLLHMWHGHVTHMWHGPVIHTWHGHVTHMTWAYYLHTHVTRACYTHVTWACYTRDMGMLHTCHGPVTYTHVTHACYTRDTGLIHTWRGPVTYTRYTGLLHTHTHVTLACYLHTHVTWACYTHVTWACYTCNIGMLHTCHGPVTYTHVARVCYTRDTGLIHTHMTWACYLHTHTHTHTPGGMRRNHGQQDLGCHLVPVFVHGCKACSETNGFTPEERVGRTEQWPHWGVALFYCQECAGPHIIWRNLPAPFWKVGVSSILILKITF